jgi:hypothetical protein
MGRLAQGLPLEAQDLVVGVRHPDRSVAECGTSKRWDRLPGVGGELLEATVFDKCQLVSNQRDQVENGFLDAK